MKKRSKKKTDGGRGTGKRRSSRSAERAGPIASIGNVTRRVVSLAGITFLAGAVLLFFLSTVAAWLIRPESGAPRVPTSVTLEVLNGCGDDGAAKEVTSILRNHGFTVIDFRNAARFDYEKTVVAVHGCPPGTAEAVAGYIGCPFSAGEGADGDGADISVIIGKDWRELGIVTGVEERADYFDSILDFFDRFHYFE